MRPWGLGAQSTRGDSMVREHSSGIHSALLFFFHPDDPIRLLREVVLLTDDRNLRVKALTRNVPVRDIPTFLKWAQEG